VNIAIIGTGNVGGALTRQLAALGHQLRIANSRGPETLTDLAAETGARAVLLDEVASGADVLIVAVPQQAKLDFPTDVFDALPESAAVVDAGNYVPGLRDAQIEELEQGEVESRWTQKQFGRPVVKAFNNITAARLLSAGKPAGAPGRIALPVAGDDATVKARVMQLVDQLGFDAIDAGGLDESWRQEPGTPVYTTDLDAAAARLALAEASTEQTVQWRARLTGGRP
jgi:predicted dinucleotide-binding enzyme